jgi:hypothetical protein
MNEEGLQGSYEDHWHRNVAVWYNDLTRSWRLGATYVVTKELLPVPYIICGKLQKVIDL